MIGEASMSKKGQALIEFILIMPVMVYLILVFVDFSLILSTKNKLDNNVSNLVMEYKERAYALVRLYVNLMISMKRLLLKKSMFLRRLV